MRSLIERLADGAVGFFSPKQAVKRRAAREVLRVMDRREARFRYRAAERNRIRNWSGVMEGADDDLFQDLPTLRQRSRELVQNSPLAAGILATLTDNVVGVGFQVSPAPRAEVLGVSEDVVLRFRDKARAIWERWLPVADAGDRMDFNGCMRLLERSALESGDSFFHFVSKPDPVRPYKLAVEVIEADRVDSPPGEEPWRMGVKLGRFGEPVAFRVYGVGDLGRAGESQVYPRLTAAGIVCDQYMVQLRPGQTRGVPALAPSLELFDDLRGYVDAEVVAARATACITAIVKRVNPVDAARGRAKGRDEDRNQIESLQPGQIEYLEPGEDVVPFNPQRPGMTFTDFVNTVTRMICRAVGLPFELGALNFSATNYSSARAALLEARRVFGVRQQLIARRFAAVAYSQLIEEAWIRGELEGIVPDGLWAPLTSEWLRAEWIFPGWGWVDPKDEVESAARAIEVGLSTRQIETQRWGGREWRDVLEASVREELAIRETRKRILGEETPKPEEPGDPEEAPEEDPEEDQAEDQEEEGNGEDGDE